MPPRNPPNGCCPTTKTPSNSLILPLPSREGLGEWAAQRLRFPPPPPARGGGINCHVCGCARTMSEPAEAAAGFSRLVGCVVTTDRAGGFAFDLERGRVRLLQPDADARRCARSHVRRERGNWPPAGGAWHAASVARQHPDRPRSAAGGVAVCFVAAA